MTIASTRRVGVSGHVAIKVPCRVATTANITLNGMQTIDGVTLVQDDRVLVKDQSSGIENGIYLADTGIWQRALDFNGPNDVVQGTLVIVVAGTLYTQSVWELSTVAPVIDTSNLAFTVLPPALNFASAWITANLLPALTQAAAQDALDVNSTSEVAALIAAAGFVPLSLFDAKGDTLAASADNTPAKFTIGADGSIPMARSAATLGLAYVSPFKGQITGLTYANNAGDATNDLDIAAGGAMDSTNAYWMALAATITKQSDVAWAVGSAAGGLDTGSVGNNDYYIHAIARSDTGAVDCLFSLKSGGADGNPTMPANYGFRRLIGWFKRVGGTVVAFHTYEIEGGGIELLWDTPTIDMASAALTTARLLSSVKVPQNFSTLALIDAAIINGATATNIRVYCPDLADVAVPSGPATPTSPVGNIGYVTGSNFLRVELKIRTSAIGQIAARA